MSFRDDPGHDAKPAPGGDPAPAEDERYQERDRQDSAEGHGTDVAEGSASGGEAAAPQRGARPSNMLPGRERRRLGLERLLVRVIATGGVIGIGVAIAAILASSKVQGWIVGLVVAGVSVVLSAILWSSRQL
jgi:hypothetical protein